MTYNKEELVFMSETANCQEPSPRELTLYPHRHTRVFAMKDQVENAGKGTCKYRVTSNNEGEHVDEVIATLDFQNGALKETGINGLMDENLIAIVIDRLQGFQSGKFRSRENAVAITKLEEALQWLNQRTAGRLARGEEGTHQV